MRDAQSRGVPPSPDEDRDEAERVLDAIEASDGEPLSMSEMIEEFGKIKRRILAEQMNEAIEG